MIDSVVAIVGMRGAGKSTYLKRSLPSLTPYLLIDPVIDPHFEQIHRPQSTQELYDLFASGTPQQVVSTPDNTASFDWMCSLVLAYGRQRLSRQERITLIVDEVDNFTTPYEIPENFRKCFAYGRHYSTNIVVCARRVVDIHKYIRSQISTWVVFPLNSEDIKTLYTVVDFPQYPELKRTDRNCEYFTYNTISHKFTKNLLTY